MILIDDHVTLLQEAEKGRDSHKFGKKSPLLRCGHWALPYYLVS
jgi:hypothetical protein